MVLPSFLCPTRMTKNVGKSPSKRMVNSGLMMTDSTIFGQISLKKVLSKRATTSTSCNHHRGRVGRKAHPENCFVWLHSEPYKCIEACQGSGRGRGAEAYPGNGIGIHMVCFPRQYLMREPVLSQCIKSIGARGAKGQEVIILADAPR